MARAESRPGPSTLPRRTRRKSAPLREFRRFRPRAYSAHGGRSEERDDPRAFLIGLGDSGW